MSPDGFAVVASATIGVVCGIAQALGLIHIPFDARFYWDAIGDPYAGGLGHYVYPPPLAQMLEPLRVLGWSLFIVPWTTLLFASLGFLLGRFVWIALGLGMLGLAVDLPLVVEPLGAALIGNVTLPMTAAVVLGMRHPAWFAVPLLTKITPGIGVLWFAFRRDWRRFAIALAVTAAVVALSFALSPAAWVDFAALAMSGAGASENGVPIVGPPLPIRLGAAVALIWWGARTDRPWVVPVASGLSLVGFYGIGSWVVVSLGSIALMRSDSRPLPRQTVPHN